MIPVQDTAHVVEATKLLTDQYRNQVTIPAILSALASEVQVLENALFALIAGRRFSTATGDALDKFGAIVGESRQGRVDADYRSAITIHMLVNRSQGRIEDLLGIAELLSSVFTYTDGIPGNWSLTLLNVPGYPEIAGLFGLAKAAGTRGVVIGSNWAPALDFVPGSVYGTVSNALGPGSAYGLVSPEGIMVTSFEEL